MKNNILRLIDKIKIATVSEFIILAMIFLVPLYFNYFSAGSIDFSKIVIFKAILFLLLFSSFCDFAFSRRSILMDRLAYIAIPLSFFFLSLILSVFFSVNINASWFGSYSRHEGLSSFLFYGLWLFLLLFNLNGIFKDKAQLKRLFLTITASSSLVSAYALAQLAGFDFFSWSEPAHLTKRAFSSFGQPNYLACWLLMVLPVSAYLLYEARQRAIRLIYLLLLLLQSGALLSTGSRSAFIALFVTFLFYCGFLVFRRRLDKKKVLIGAMGFTSLLLIFLVSLALLNPQRLEEFRDLRRGSGGARLQLWESGLKAFLDKPVFGYGLENQSEAYLAYYEKDWAVYSRPNTYSDRAHNLILDIALTSGLFGLACFFYFIYRIFNSLWIAYKRSNDNIFVFLAWLISSYLFSLLFNFSVTVTNVYFFLFVALAFLASGPIFRKDSERFKKPIPYLIVLGGFILMIYGVFAQIRVMQADYYFNKALRAIDDNQYFTALVLNDYILQSRPNPIFTLHYGQEISLRLIEKLPAIQDRSSRYVINNYLHSFADNSRDNGFESRFVKAFALGVSGSRGASEEIFQELALKSPYLPKIYLAWGDVSLMSGNFQKAEVKFEKAKSLLPELDNPYLNEDHLRQLQYYYGLIDSRLDAIRQLTNK